MEGDFDPAKWPCDWLGVIIAGQTYVDFRKADQHKMKLEELLKLVQHLAEFPIERVNDAHQTLSEMELNEVEKTIPWISNLLKSLSTKARESIMEKKQITKDVENKFLEAATLGELSQLEKIIEDYGPEILKSVDEVKANALHRSAKFGTLQGTKFFVERHDFDMSDSSNNFGRNAFLFSASGGNEDQMNYFVKTNPDILKTIDSNKYNALHLSARFGTLEGTEFLVANHGFDIFDGSNDHGRNAFLFSASGSKKDQMEYFIKTNPNILKTVDSEKFNALHHSARSGSLEVTKFLVEKHDFDIFDNSNKLDRNAFLLSAARGKVDQMDYFIKTNPNILKTVDSDQFNALHHSARSGSLEVTKFLVEKHDFDIFDSSNTLDRNAFLLSAARGKVDQMDYFIKTNPDILKTVDSDKYNALHLSACFGTLRGTEFLVEKHNFDIFDKSNKHQSNALEFARQYKKQGQLKYFLHKIFKRELVF